jgi:hypothetical protein
MDEQQEQTNAIARFAEAVKSRRALLGSGLATVGLAAFRDDDQEAAAGKRRNRRRRRRRRGGGNGLGFGDCPGSVCLNRNDGPFCKYTSIQAAIDDINNLDPPPEEIVVCPGVYKERITVNPLTEVNLTIQATSSTPSDTTIDADGDGTALTINRGVFITFDSFTITGGKAAFGGGVVNRGFLTIRNSVVTDNDTGAADDSGGGGIYNDGGNLTLNLTEVSDNHALDGQGGGILNVGGKVLLQGDTQVTKNMADQGGGLFNQGGGTVTIDDDSSVTDNEPDNCVGTSACGA